MPVTARFEADFSQFHAGAETATAKLRTLVGGTADVQTAMSRMVTGMSQAGQAATVSSKMIAGMSTATTTAAGTSTHWTGELRKFDGMLASLGINIGAETRAIGELGEVSGKSAKELGVLATAGAVFAAAIAGWKVGRLVSDFFGLDKAIGDATAKLLGYGDVAGQVAGAKQDVINAAVKRGADAMISYSDALRFNNEWFVKRQASTQKFADEEKKALEDVAKVAAKALQNRTTAVERAAAAHLANTKRMVDEERRFAAAIDATFDRIRIDAPKVVMSWENIFDSLKPVTMEMEKLKARTLEVAGVLVKEMPAGMTAAQDAMRETRRRTGELADAVAGHFRTALEGIPNIFINAFTGGGGVIGALKAIGVSLLEAVMREILEPLINAAANAAGRIAGSILNAFLPPSLGGGGGGISFNIPVPGIGFGGGGPNFGGRPPGLGPVFNLPPPVPIPGIPGLVYPPGFHPTLPPGVGRTPHHPWLTGRGAEGMVAQGGNPNDDYVGFGGGTHGRYVDFGAGTNVTLHGKEKIVPEGQGAGGGTIVVPVNLDGRELTRVVVRLTPDVLRELGVA